MSHLLSHTEFLTSCSSYGLFWQITLSFMGEEGHTLWKEKQNYAQALEALVVMILITTAIRGWYMFFCSWSYKIPLLALKERIQGSLKRKCINFHNNNTRAQLMGSHKMANTVVLSCFSPRRADIIQPETRVPLDSLADGRTNKAEWHKNRPRENKHNSAESRKDDKVYAADRVPCFGHILI